MANFRLLWKLKSKASFVTKRTSISIGLKDKIKDIENRVKTLHRGENLLKVC